ncbi:DUF2798 domain-containing protein [Vagococcus sp. BWB3-3]|uniref:DUF2798 domain-containing protein n=1 Tax=Vagococcus allomyrinae TaxID=2794353 RepID=A0A940PIP7_9ENTE|nr:DUF2798 domain-containing protein [Vagococcus allomyrinae]MBP1044301.1 DUF2798 domain-containing protein [Vagococcus allomyrinae]
MKQERRLPQTSKEGLLYGVVICGITAFLMASFNIYLQVKQVNMTLVVMILKAFPLFFLIALLLETFVMHQPVEKLVRKFTEKDDSFNAVILFTVLFTVVGMSFSMTIIGDFIGHGFLIEQGFLLRFLAAWPRNFAIVLMIELLIAQPLARKVMTVLHQNKSAEYQVPLGE